MSDLVGNPEDRFLMTRFLWILTKIIFVAKYTLNQVYCSSQKSAFKSLKNVKPPITYTISRDNPIVRDYTVQSFTKYMRDTFDELKVGFKINLLLRILLLNLQDFLRQPNS